METRCIPCRSQHDYGAPSAPNYVENGELSATATRALDDVLRRVDDAIARGWRRTGDDSVYVGDPGVAYYLMRRGDVEAARELIEQPFRPRPAKAKDCSIMCGRTGVDLIAALCAPREDAFLQRAAAIVARTDVACSELLEADEWLYGRVGFLRALLELRREGRAVPGLDEAIRRVVAATLASGRRHGGDGLRYAWHGKEYVGAAHGYAGILYLLLKAGCRDPALRAMSDKLRGLETREGNWPSSLPDARSKLVHFCHGAPGVVFAMAEAHRVYGDEAFRDACLRGAETVWQYGLLTKGPGLCHGVAGNGYALLAAYRVSRDPRWLHRAVVFGTCIGDDGVCARQRTPDNPFSLFEGLAGSACFLRDLRESRFFGAGLPLYEVDVG